MKNKVIILNFILCGIGSLILGLGARIIFLGTKEEWLVLKHNLPSTYFQRLIPFVLIGLIGVIILFGLNFVINKTLLNNDSKINLLKLTLINTIIVLISCILGTMMFFL
jgi:hypothetical protein